MRDDGVSQTRAERAAHHIGELAAAASAGARLGTKEEIRQACGVSVGTFNEALRLAQSRGLVSVRPGPGGGLFAAQQSPLVRLGNSVLALDADETSVADAIRIRDVLDQLIIFDAAWHSSPADLTAYSAQLAAMAQAKQHSDGAAFMTANWRLHELLVRVNPSPILRAIYTALLEVIRAHTTDIHPAQGHTLDELMDNRYQVHAELVDAITERDADRLGKAIAGHSLEHTNDYRRLTNLASSPVRESASVPADGAGGSRNGGFVSGGEP